MHLYGYYGVIQDYAAINLIVSKAVLFRYFSYNISLSTAFIPHFLSNVVFINHILI
jgi:hypothetical protein